MNTEKFIRLIAICMLLIVSCKSASSKDVVHTIERGETLGYIADLYGTTVEKIRMANSEFEGFYTGMDIVIPVDQNSGEIEKQKLLNQNSLYSEANDLLLKGKYKDAVKLYDKVLVDGKTPLDVYYNRGKAQWQRGKLNESINDLCYVVNNDIDQSFPDAEDILNEVRRQKQIKDEERSQMWANIGAAITATAVVATNVYAASEAEKTQRRSNSGFNINPVGGSLAAQMQTPGYFESVQQQLMQKTITDFNNQQIAEYNMFCAYNKKSDGSNYTFDEWLAMKAQAASLLQDQGGSVNSGSVNNAGTSSSKDILNTTYGEDCKACNGSGKCSACNGTKVASGMGNTYACTVCNKNGTCPVCKGTGKTSWNR